MFEKKCFNTERANGIFVRKNLKKKKKASLMRMENATNSEGFLMHYKGHPSNNLFQLFLK